ncbi:MAG TPA: uracil-DNA glycosylase, partial [Candidatus Nitrosocosmicus sp.]|nr:uracil-DNA glycosylase [Candidatus Nitrosocosmicus sp.]
SWKNVLESEFNLPYWTCLTEFVRKQYTSNTVYPHPKQVFRAFDLCPFEEVKVVIVGQDPYHGINQANGLSFAVNEKVPLPPSLKNIYQEIQNDLKITPFASGDLSRWAKQGVLLLNSVLTVQAGMAASHSGKGWEQFTDAVIRSLNAKRSHIVYMLWGKYAQTKGQVINREQNLILTSGHPSPFSSHLFFGHHHFSQCNKYLQEHGLTPIDWR